MFNQFALAQSPSLEEKSHILNSKETDLFKTKSTLKSEALKKSVFNRHVKTPSTLSTNSLKNTTKPALALERTKRIDVCDRFCLSHCTNCQKLYGNYLRMEE